MEEELEEEIPKKRRVAVDLGEDNTEDEMINLIGGKNNTKDFMQLATMKMLQNMMSNQQKSSDPMQTMMMMMFMQNMQGNKSADDEMDRTINKMYKHKLMSKLIKDDEPQRQDDPLQLVRFITEMKEKQEEKHNQVLKEMRDQFSQMSRVLS